MTCQKDKNRLCNNFRLKVDYKQSCAMIIGTKMDCKIAKK